MQTHNPSKNPQAHMTPLAGTFLLHSAIDQPDGLFLFHFLSLSLSTFRVDDMERGRARKRTLSVCELASNCGTAIQQMEQAGPLPTVVRASSLSPAPSLPLSSRWYACLASALDDASTALHSEYGTSVNESLSASHHAKSPSAFSFAIAAYFRLYAKAINRICLFNLFFKFTLNRVAQQCHPFLL